MTTQTIQSKNDFYTNKSLDRKIKAYLISNIDNSGYSDHELKTDNDKTWFLLRTFLSEYSHDIERFGTERALSEWLMGLPSSLSIDFYYYDINRLGVQWGAIPENDERNRPNIVEDWEQEWFKLLANKLMDLFKPYGPGKPASLLDVYEWINQVINGEVTA